MRERAVTTLWKTGIRTFRLARRANVSTLVEPLFVYIAGILPTSTEAVSAKLPDGSTLRMPPGYRDTRTVIVGLFQEAETKLFKQLLGPGMTFVDIGAYVGYFSVIAAGLVGTLGRVYAFEPDE